MGILLFAVVLSVLIVVHEWGHYYAAKRLGIRVERFSIGFGPILFKTQPKETEFCVSLFPLGGYVKLAGESPSDSTGEAWEFHTRPRWHKFIVVFAGPLLNAILAFLIFSVIFIIGQPSFTSHVGEVVEDFPAYHAGLQSGDRITRINNDPIELWEDVLVAIHSNKTDRLVVEVNRDQEILTYDLSPKMDKTKDIFGREQTVPRIGITPQGDTVHVKAPFGEAIVMGIKKVFFLTKLILMSLGMILSGAMSFKDSMAGPIGIYMMTQQAAQIGIVPLLDFMARLSVSLWVINLLPIPVLDGGHLFFILIESIIRRPISDRVKEMSMQVGMVLVLLLTVYVIYQDVLKFELWGKLISVFGGS